MTPLIIAALLGLTGALVVAFPLLGLTRERESVQPTSGSDVSERERQARQALREVELDYTLGNLESGDYDTLRGRYERRALAALRTRYQREQEMDARIERELDALRSSESPSAGPVSAGAKASPVARAAQPAASPRVVRPGAARDRRANRKGGA